MIYVHVPVPEPTYPHGIDGGFNLFELVRALLVDGYGRTSACLLSIVSGYLVAKTLKGSAPRYRLFYKRRFRSIYVPMVVWGLATVVVFSFVSMMQTTFVSDVCGGNNVVSINCVNVVFHISSISTGPTMHLAFLRDLFVCMLLAPVLLVVVRRIPVIGLTALGLIYLLDWETVLVLRPLVILGFTVGLAIGIRQINFAWVDRLWMCWVCLAILLALLTTAFNNGQFPQLQWHFAIHGLDARETLLYPLTRLFGALALWSLSLKLMSLPLMKWSAKLEPFLFIAFCSHPLLLSVLQELSSLVSVDASVMRLFPVWFIFAPAVSIAAAVLGMRLCSYLLPNLLHMISGGRIVASPLKQVDANSQSASPILADARSG